MSTLTISQYTANPTAEISADSVLEVRSWYSRNFIASDGVTPIFGNTSSGQQGPYYYSITPTLNGSGDLVVPAHIVQPTTESNPTGSYFEGLWVDGAFSQLLMPNTNGATGWQIPTVYGDPIAYDEIAYYNRAKRLLYAPDTYFTADETIREIERIAGQFAYAAVNVNGITSIYPAPDLASLPIAYGANAKTLPATTSATAYTSQYASFNLAVAAIEALGGGVVIVDNASPVTSSIATLVTDVIRFEGSGILTGSSKTVTLVGPLEAPLKQIWQSGITILFTNNVSLGPVSPQWWGAKGDDSTDCTAAFQAMLHINEYNGSLGGVRFFIPNGTYRVSNLTYRGDYSHSFVMEGCSQGEAASADGPILKYVGSAGGTMFQMLGANWCQVRNIQFDGNGLALRDVVIDYDSSRSQSSFDVEIDNCNFGGAVGVDSTCLVLGTSAGASAEHLVQNSRFISSGSAGTTYYGIRNFGSANAKDHTIRSCDLIAFRVAIWFGNSGYNTADGCSFAANTVGDVHPGGGNLAVTNFSSEGSTKLIEGDALNSTVAGTLLLQNGYFAGAGDASGYVVTFAGKLTVKNCEFGAGASYGDNPPKFKTGFGNYGSGIVSLNNLYNWNAVTASDFIPFYDGSDRLIGTLNAAAIGANLLSSGDSARDATHNPTVAFPYWNASPAAGLAAGGYPKFVTLTLLSPDYSPAHGDGAIYVDASAGGPYGTGGSAVFLLSAANAGKGKVVHVIRTDAGAPPLYVIGSAGEVNGTDRVTLTNKYDYVILQSDGSAWHVVDVKIGEMAGQLTLSGGGTQTYTWKNAWTIAPLVVASDTDATPAAVGASSTTTTLTVRGTAGHVVNYVAYGRNF